MENPIFERRSIRTYTDEPVSREDVLKLLRAGMQAPSGGNQQPWEFIVVDDAGLKERLAGCSPYAGAVGKSAISIVLLVRADESCRFPEIKAQDMAACAENILLQATDLGLGAVWQAVYPTPERMAYVKELFSLDDSVEPFCVISLGHPKGEPAKPKSRFDESRVHWNKY